MQKLTVVAEIAGQKAKLRHPQHSETNMLNLLNQLDMAAHR